MFWSGIYECIMTEVPMYEFTHHCTTGQPLLTQNKGVHCGQGTLWQRCITFSMVLWIQTRHGYKCNPPDLTRAHCGTFTDLCEWRHLPLDWGDRSRELHVWLSRGQDRGTLWICRGQLWGSRVWERSYMCQFSERLQVNNPCSFLSTKQTSLVANLPPKSFSSFTSDY